MGWTIERPGGGVVLHELGCIRAPADGPELSLDDAVTAYTWPGARACGKCAAEVLDRLWKVPDPDGPHGNAPSPGLAPF
ncbi:DUF6233 domain-containing protein [Streptomyces virginiae]|uniref:DUF6233 domain-containing protein n=1 Tax=Streptomyces virginiae TaxID=1961 RepID=UPI00369E94E2